MSTNRYHTQQALLDEKRFNIEMAKLLEVPVITAVHSESWRKKLKVMIITAEKHHWFKQLERLTAIHGAIRCAQGRKGDT